MTLHPVIAIDGPAASGKSTVSRLLAQKLNYVYVDTGAMYRAFAWHVLESGIAPQDARAVAEVVVSIPFEVTIQNQRVVLRIQHQDPTPFIRSEAVNQAVSRIASVPELRERLVTCQRALRRLAPLVMEGRDIGTVVCPDTPFKFFLDADPAIRETRRRHEGQTDQLSERDRLDRNRATAPLIRAADAHVIDTGTLTPEQIVDQILQTIRSVE